MTTYEHIMLAVCFGAVCGWLLVGLGFGVKSVYDFCRDRLKKKEKK